MKAVVIREFGGPDVLRLEDVPDPVPGPGDVVVQVYAVSVNRVLDVAMRNGEQRHRGVTLPLIPGVAPSGVIVAVGKNRWLMCWERNRSWIGRWK